MTSSICCRAKSQHCGVAFQNRSPDGVLGPVGHDQGEAIGLDAARDAEEPIDALGAHRVAVQQQDERDRRAEIVRQQQSRWSIAAQLDRRAIRDGFGLRLSLLLDLLLDLLLRRLLDLRLRLSLHLLLRLLLAPPVGPAAAPALASVVAAVRWSRQSAAAVRRPSRPQRPVVPAAREHLPAPRRPEKAPAGDGPRRHNPPRAARRRASAGPGML